jgi:acyl transferase domain-containing protein
MQSLTAALSMVATRKSIRRIGKSASPENASGMGNRPAPRAPGNSLLKPLADHRTVFMFAGEGSQYFQMGRDLFKQYPLFRKHMLEADRMVQELCGCSVLQLLYEHGYSAAETFDRTLFSHPAIFMVQYATARVLIDSGVAPDVTMGTGIGSFAAAAVAGHLTMEDALLAVIRQASMFEVCCPRGGMLAVLHDRKLYEEALRPAIGNDCEIASFNLPGHFVIAARQDALGEIEASLRAKGVALQKLPVPYPFHSRWIDVVETPFTRFMWSVTGQPGRLPLMCSFGCELLTHLPANYFWRALREPVRFHDAIGELENQGTFRYVDIGPAATLSTIVTRTLASTSASTATSTLTPFGQDLKNISALIRSSQ